MTDETRFWAKVDKSGDCWQWLGSLARGGYGRFKVDGSHYTSAHRLAYRLCVGPIPDGLTIDHLCRNRLCVNPAHMEPVTLLENIRRRPIRVLRECVNGHPMTPENIAIWSGRRKCRTCALEHSRRTTPQRVEANRRRDRRMRAAS